MAVIKPFRGIRYDPNTITDISSVITPPYDVIDTAEQERLHRKSEFNIIHLEYGISKASDTEKDNRYTRAAETINRWLEQNVLVYDPKPFFYLYEQSFSHEGKNYHRTGLVATLKLEPYSKRVILPHELTMTGPKQDRLELLRSTRTNISPIFTLFPDPEAKIKTLSLHKSEAPIVEAVEENGQTHRLWLLKDHAFQVELAEYLASQQLLIADGHHRYETALKYFESAGSNPIPGSAYIMTMMVSMKDSGLLMLPTHRLLDSLTEEEFNRLNSTVNEQFKVIDFGPTVELNKTLYLKELNNISRLNRGFGWITREQAFVLFPKSSQANRELPVSLLHDQLLKPFHKTARTEDPAEDRLHYTHNFDSAVNALLSGKSHSAFILDTIPVEDVFERARQGLVMPQKSTYFYPKLPSGLVLYRFNS
ncbi:MAG: DUF1015 domain-containing protein [Bacillota bacterium]|nr:DUF1015 domain-containing protein [Bacillota bacterium]